MMINCVLVAGSLALSLVRVPATSQSRSQRTLVAPATMAVADSFSPPTKTKKRHSPSRRGAPSVEPNPESVDDDTEATAPPPKRQSPPPSRRREPPVVEEDQDDTARDSDEEGEDGHPAKRHATRTRRNATDQDEDDSSDEDQQSVSLPAVQPRLVSFGGGASAVGRQFQFNTPLQKEATFPRLGIALSLETYPLIHLSRGWFRKFGIGAAYSLEGGSAALLQGDGSSNSFPVRQQRWSVDLRYLIPLGERVVVIPAVGYGGSLFDLQRLTSVAPSLCNNASTTPCLTDTQTGFLIADLHLKIAATPEFAVSLTGGYLQGLSVGKSAGQIGSEASSTSMTGFHGELATSSMLSDWWAIQVAIPFTTYSYKFGGGTATYGSARETTYGLTVGVVLFTR